MPHSLHNKMQCSNKDFFRKYDSEIKIIFTEEIINGKIHFLRRNFEGLKRINSISNIYNEILLQKELEPKDC